MNVCARPSPLVIEVATCNTSGRSWIASPPVLSNAEDAAYVTSVVSPSAEVAIPADMTNMVSGYFNFNGLAVGAGGVWIEGDERQRVVWRVDPNSLRIVKQIRLATTTLIRFPPNDCRDQRAPQASSFAAAEHG